LRHNGRPQNAREIDVRNPSGFRPAWWATLATVLLGSVFLAAGFWQLSRAEEKRALLEAFDSGASMEPSAPPLATGETANLRYQAVRATGRYDAGRQVLLDARVRDGRAGYEVLTPLLTGSGAILVNRGWIAANPDRTRLPDLSVGVDERTVTGLLDRLPRPALALDSESSGSASRWPQRLLYPTAEQISAALGYPVRDYQILLAADDPEGYFRDWRPALLAPQEHLGYAVQWFALAVTLAAIYVVLGLRRRESP
jgi:surfeit locus 1 family protein